MLDASAILAVMFQEEGRDRVLGVFDRSIVSAVNLAEVVTKLVEKGKTGVEIAQAIEAFRPMSVDFCVLQAMRAGLLRAPTRRLGLSMGDRCCLALAQDRGVGVMTADRAWAGLDIGVAIEVIR